MQSRQGRGERLDALGLAKFFIGEIKRCSGGNVAAFAFCGCAGCLRTLNVLRALLQSFLRRKLPQLLIVGHRFAPIGQGALGIALGGFAKALVGLLVLERVQ